MPYPDRQTDVERLVAQHRRLKDQTLLLALYYARPDAPEDVFLLEVVSPFGHNEVGDDPDLFEIEYGSTDGFPLPPGHRLHILLVNPIEFKAAVQGEWPALRPLLDAVQQGRFHVLYAEAAGEALLTSLSAERVAA